MSNLLDIIAANILVNMQFITQFIMQFIIIEIEKIVQEYKNAI